MCIRDSLRGSRARGLGNPDRPPSQKMKAADIWKGLYWDDKKEFVPKTPWAAGGPLPAVLEKHSPHIPASYRRCCRSWGAWGKQCPKKDCRRKADLNVTEEIYHFHRRAG